MDESHAFKEQRLKQLELDNQSHSERAIAVSKLCDDWQKANLILTSKGLPRLTLREYQEAVNYSPDDALVFLAGVDEAWLKEYQERIRLREIASAAYHASQPRSNLARVGDFIQVVAIGIFVALFVGFIFLLLY